MISIVFAAIVMSLAVGGTAWLVADAHVRGRKAVRAFRASTVREPVLCTCGDVRCDV